MRCITLPIAKKKPTIFSPFIPPQCWSVLCASNLLAASTALLQGPLFPSPSRFSRHHQLGWTSLSKISSASAGSSQFLRVLTTSHSTLTHSKRSHFVIIVLVCDIKFVIFLPQLPHTKNVGMCFYTQWLVLAGKKKCTVRIRLQSLLFSVL